MIARRSGPSATMGGVSDVRRSDIAVVVGLAVAGIVEAGIEHDPLVGDPFVRIVRGRRGADGRGIVNHFAGSAERLFFAPIVVRTLELPLIEPGGVMAVQELVRRAV